MSIPDHVLQSYIDQIFNKFDREGYGQQGYPPQQYGNQQGYNQQQQYGRK